MACDELIGTTCEELRCFVASTSSDNDFGNSKNIVWISVVQSRDVSAALDSRSSLET